MVNSRGDVDVPAIGLHIAQSMKRLSASKIERENISRIIALAVPAVLCSAGKNGPEVDEYGKDDARYGRGQSG